jgi:hypothetical protein
MIQLTGRDHLCAHVMLHFLTRLNLVVDLLALAFVNLSVHLVQLRVNCTSTGGSAQARRFGDRVCASVLIAAQVEGAWGVDGVEVAFGARPATQWAPLQGLADAVKAFCLIR